MDNVRVNFIPLSIVSEVCPLLLEHSITIPNCNAHNYHTQTYLTQTTTVKITFLAPTVFHRGGAIDLAMSLNNTEICIWQVNLSLIIFKNGILCSLFLRFPNNYLVSSKLLSSYSGVTGWNWLTSAEELNWLIETFWPALMEKLWHIGFDWPQLTDWKFWADTHRRLILDSELWTSGCVFLKHSNPTKNINIRYFTTHPKLHSKNPPTYKYLINTKLIRIFFWNIQDRLSRTQGYPTAAQPPMLQPILTHPTLQYYHIINQHS